MKRHAWLVILMILSCCTSVLGENLRLRVRMVWYPQAQFAGFYMAKKRGFYKEAGLDVEILHGSPTKSTSQALEEGQAEIAVEHLMNALASRKRGMKVCSIGQMFRKSAVLFIAQKKSGIDSIGSMNGRSIAIWSKDIPLFRQVMSRLGIHDCQVVPVINPVDVFLYGAVDICVGMEYNELYHIQMNGIRREELIIFPVRDYLPHFSEDGLYALEDFVKAHGPALVAFREATKKGWEEAFRCQEETLEEIKRVTKEEERYFLPALQKWQLEYLQTVLDLQQNDCKLSRALFRDMCDFCNVRPEDLRYEDFVLEELERRP